MPNQCHIWPNAMADEWGHQVKKEKKDKKTDKKRSKRA